MVAIIWGVGIAIRLFVSAVDKWMKKSEYIQRRNLIYFGLCIIALLSIYGKIHVMEGENVDKFFVFIIINIFCASYAVFITPNEKYCEWKQKSGKVYEFFLLILVCIHTYILYLSIIESPRHKDLRNFIFVQLSFSLICASSTCDILGILTGKLKLKEAKGEEGVELDTIKVDKRPSASTQPVAHVGYVQVKEEIPFSTRVYNAVRDFSRLFQKN
ncbi:hypothetical protein CAEBREN_23257 [Caenorhabditis brenneri]|uniref:Uncharacterized protein n=1 Tax=Caenorhabditis brenneri TaxID=135651 RepID=G0MWT2_CAEBE|nr:hypothetical protein CAEBREN_23257 [Caenorhabditis brenneri]